MSAFFGARAPELIPESARDLNVKPAQHRKQPLKERSLSDLNKNLSKDVASRPKPTIRLVESDNDSSSIYARSPLPTKASHILDPANDDTRKLKNRIFVDTPEPESRPTTRDGASSRLYTTRKPNRMSVSTTTSMAETIVADSLLSPTSRRFSVESVVKAPRPQYSIAGQDDHLEPLQERSSDLLEMQSSGMPDIPELPSSLGNESRHLAHSSSVYSSVALDNLSSETPRRARPRSSSSDLGFSVSPVSEREREMESCVESTPRHEASNDSMAESAGSASTQERGTPHIIRYVSSSDSIQPQFASLRPAPYHSKSANSLWSEGSVDDVDVPPLHIPRKRGHMHSASLNSYPSMTRMGVSHLSTIASETEIPESSRFNYAQSPVAGQSWPRRRKTVTSSTYSESVASPRLEQGVKASSSYDTMSSAVHSSDSAMPEPLFSSSAPILQMPFNNDLRSSSGQHMSELDDTIGELQALPLREKRSGYFVRKRSVPELRPSSRQSNHTVHSTIETERWSTGSFIFPQWAQFFYTGRGQLLSAKGSMQTLAARPSIQTLRGPGYDAANASRITLAGPPYASFDRGTRSFDFSRASAPISHSRNSTVGTYISRPESSHSNWETVCTESPARLPGMSRTRPRPRSQTHAPTPSRETVSVFSSPSSSPTIPTSEAPKPRTRTSLRASLRSSMKAHPLRQNPPKGKDARKSSGRPSINDHGARVRSPLGTAPPSSFSFPTLVPNSRLARSLTAWRVPSIDEPFPNDMFGPGNRQIVCFCLGFLMPPLWMLAAFLPLPRCGWRDDREAEWGVEEEKTSGRPPQEGLDVRVEQRWGWDEERKWLKANWWRNLNRVMSVVGVGILAAIIALAVLASRS